MRLLHRYLPRCVNARVIYNLRILVALPGLFVLGLVISVVPCTTTCVLGATTLLASRLRLPVSDIGGASLLD